MLCFTVSSIENSPFVLSLSKHGWNKLTLPGRRRPLRQAQGERSFLGSNRDLFGRALEVRAEHDPFVPSLSKHDGAHPSFDRLRANGRGCVFGVVVNGVC